jgi:hypothetical protein
VGRSRLRACTPGWAGSVGATVKTVTSCRFDPGFAPAYAVAFTPDGRSLVFADDNRVRLVSLPEHFLASSHSTGQRDSALIAATNSS